MNPNELKIGCIKIKDRGFVPDMQAPRPYQATPLKNMGKALELFISDEKIEAANI